MGRARPVRGRSRVEPAPLARGAEDSASPDPVAAPRRRKRGRPLSRRCRPSSAERSEFRIVFDSDLTPLLSAATGRAESDGGWFVLRERLAHLGLVEGFDELICLTHLKGVETFWYQTETVRKVLKQFRGRVLLADEVGLGKTVEAGMVLKEYVLRGMVERVLVLAPASLVGQWREELETKFDIPCATTQDPLLRDDPERFWAQPRIVASLALARRKEHAERLIAQSFDLVIVDEAHHLRDRSSQSYSLVDRLTKRFLLLLSATPVQNNLIELYNLLTLLKPGIFKTQKEFRAAYMTAGKPRQPANPERLRDLMRDAMIRNTRAVVALKLPRRHASTRYVDPTPPEQAAYQELAAMIRTLVCDGQHRAAIGSRVTICSTPPAPRPRPPPPPFERFAARHDRDPAWRALAERWEAVAAGAKELALLELIARNPDEKKLVFVHHRETMSSLAGLLAGQGHRIRPLRRRHERSRQGRGDRRFPRAGSGAAVHRIRRRGPQHPVLQHADQLRYPLESDGDRTARRPHRPHRSEPRGVRVQSGHPRDGRGADAAAARRKDQHVRAGGRRGRRDPGRTGRGAELRRSGAGRVAGDDSAAARTEAFDALGRRLGEAQSQYGDAKALDDALFGEDFETA